MSLLRATWRRWSSSGIFFPRSGAAGLFDDDPRGDSGQDQREAQSWIPTLPRWSDRIVDETESLESRDILAPVVVALESNFGGSSELLTTVLEGIDDDEG